MNDEQQKLAHEAAELEQSQEWSQAADRWNELSQQVDDPQLTFKAAQSLFRAKRFQEAYQSALHLPDELINEDNGLLIIKIYVAVNHYISGRMAANQLPASIQTQARELIAESEKNYRQQYQATVHNRLRNFYHLGDCNLSEQRQRLANADQLPLPDFMVGCQFLLRDPFTNPFVRSELLNILQRLKWDQEVVMLTIDDQDHRVTPADCQSAYQSDAIRQCRKIVANQFTDNNPQLLATLNQQLDLQAILLAPIADQIIVDPAKWIQVLECLLLGEAMPADSSDEQQWQNKINRIIEKIN